ncbi:hypothetical protein PsorP6_016668 [Peronosclerospora sorghi]|uniref:Uncharacterized protein n=1 Tax=Peronosclerospora sorghi TaxID=230839 RepID=A0ACC0VTH3_9STRA|nr:hypothetical protein PsorP6_016668 [Peronosclerospora sorghi]
MQDQEGVNDLPSSLPSYMPPSSQSVNVASHHGFSLMEQPGTKTHTEMLLENLRFESTFVCMNNDAGVQGLSPNGTQPSPSEAMNGLKFRKSACSAGFQMMAGYDKGVASTAADIPVTLKLGQQRTAPASQISAAQFEASTGGLAMDTALLARVSGTDPSLMGSEEIKQIMCTPDLLSIYQKLQEEDERRQRRLERNRASARVRREKKKGMVETYEGEVSKLESSLNMLKKHEFGTGNAQELATALEYSPREHLRHALMSKDAKMELMARILGHHSRNTDAIRRANAENQALIAVSSDDSELFLSLRTQLGLTPEQCQRIASLATSVTEEARKLDAIRKCFSALRAHEWLYVPGIEVGYVVYSCILTSVSI